MRERVAPRTGYARENRERAPPFEKRVLRLFRNSAGLFHRSSKGSIRFKRSPTRSCLTLEDDVVWDGLMYKQSFHRTTKE